MTTAPDPNAETKTDAPVETPSAPQLSRSDVGAAIVSLVVGALAIFGLLPIGLTAEQVIAIGTGIFTLLALGRTLWERRKELNHQMVVQQARQSASFYRDLYAEARARHAADLQRIEAVKQVALRAADPSDDTKLSPDAIVDMLALPPASDSK